MHFKERVVLFIASGGYIGRIPIASGTFGSLLGLPVCYLFPFDKLSTAIPFTVVFIGFSIWIAHRAEGILNAKDPGVIVIDEVAGLFVTFIGIPFNLIAGISGFLLFRLLDIVKPYPARAFERRMTGGVGVVMDDVIAGIYANLILRIIMLFIPVMASRL